MIKRLVHLTYEERLRKLVKKIRGNLINVNKCVDGGCNQMEPGTFQWYPVQKAVGSHLKKKLKQKMFHLARGNMVFIVRVTEHWSKLLRRVVESSLLGDIQKSSGYSRQPALCVSA